MQNQKVYTDVILMKKYTPNKAIIISKIAFLSSQNKDNKAMNFDGKRWSFLSTETMADCFPWISKQLLFHHIKELVQSGVILKTEKEMNGRTVICYAVMDADACKIYHLPNTADHEVLRHSNQNDNLGEGNQFCPPKSETPTKKKSYKKHAVKNILSPVKNILQNADSSKKFFTETGDNSLSENDLQTRKKNTSIKKEERITSPSDCNTLSQEESPREDIPQEDIHYSSSAVTKEETVSGTKGNKGSFQEWKNDRYAEQKKKAYHFISDEMYKRCGTYWNSGMEGRHIKQLVDKIFEFAETPETAERLTAATLNVFWKEKRTNTFYAKLSFLPSKLNSNVIFPDILKRAADLVERKYGKFRTNNEGEDFENPYAVLESEGHKKAMELISKFYPPMVDEKKKISR